MPKQLCLSAIIDVPDDFFDAAELTTRIKPSWQQLCSELKQAGVRYEVKQDLIETRAKSVAGSGAKRGRKPKPNADGAQQPANPAALVST